MRKRLRGVQSCDGRCSVETALGLDRSVPRAEIRRSPVGDGTRGNAGMVLGGWAAWPGSKVRRCLGVLAAEVRHGAEYNPATQAAATMIAAQLATVVPAWPAASVTQRDGAAPVVEEPPAPGKATIGVRSA